jgi:nucleoside-diphosphate-sugar epimerase
MRFNNVDELEEALSAPSHELSDDLEKVPGDILILGVGGKMGPTLARMAKRAAPKRRVIGVARFSQPEARASLERYGIECITCDLLDRAAVAALPDAPNVIFLAGRKFGSKGREDLTWAVNAYVPALVAQRFASARIVAFSTACVYPYVPYSSGGAREDTATVPPAGDYANSCVARERIFEYFSRLNGTPGRLIRLSYAIDARYGVLHDIAAKVAAGEPVDLTMAYVNVIWQRDANLQALRALAYCTTPTSGLNVSGPMHSVKDIAMALGKRIGKCPIFTGEPAGNAWLVNCDRSIDLFGGPSVGMEPMLDAVSAWLMDALPTLGKSTHFEVRDGNY